MCTSAHVGGPPECARRETSRALCGTEKVLRHDSWQAVYLGLRQRRSMWPHSRPPLEGFENILTACVGSLFAVSAFHHRLQTVRSLFSLLHAFFGFLATAEGARISPHWTVGGRRNLYWVKREGFPLPIWRSLLCFFLSGTGRGCKLARWGVSLCWGALDWRAARFLDEIQGVYSLDWMLERQGLLTKASWSAYIDGSHSVLIPSRCFRINRKLPGISPFHKTPLRTIWGSQSIFESEKDWLKGGKPFFKCRRFLSYSWLCSTFKYSHRHLKGFCASLWH